MKGIALNNVGIDQLSTKYVLEALLDRSRTRTGGTSDRDYWKFLRHKRLLLVVEVKGPLTKEW